MEVQRQGVLVSSSQQVAGSSHAIAATHHARHVAQSHPPVVQGCMGGWAQAGCSLIALAGLAQAVSAACCKQTWELLLDLNQRPGHCCSAVGPLIKDAWSRDTPNQLAVLSYLTI